MQKDQKPNNRNQNEVISNITKNVTNRTFKGVMKFEQWKRVRKDK
jgi:hypothetical protein